MSLHMNSARTGSGRPQSRINPITGEEMPYTARDAPTRDTGNHGNNHSNHDNRSARRHSPPRLQASGRNCEQTRPESRPMSGARTQTRPDSVPKLTLGILAAEDDDPDLTLNMDPYSYKLETPGPPSTVSWGTPGSVPGSAANQRKLQDLQHYSDLSHQVCHGSSRQPQPSQRHQSPQGKPAHQQLTSQRDQQSHRSERRHLTPHKQLTAWDIDKDPLPENLPPPPPQYKQQYQQLQQEMKDSYRNYSDRTITNSEVEQKIEELRLDIPIYDPHEEDDQHDRLQKDWTTQPYSKAAQLRRQDKDSLEEINRKKKLLETVMIDQLSRPMISRPESSAVSSRPSSYRPGMKRGSVRTLHDSKVATGNATENLLSKRIQFGARVLTRNGRDALRELTGFYFAVDNSITVYEFRQFGKSAKALPFIQRGAYCHLHGPKQGEPYTISDIRQGGCLYVESRDQPVPDAMKAKHTTVLKITEVDDNAKAAILFDGVPVGQQDDVWKRAHIPQTKEEINNKVLLMQVQDCVHSQIRKRGIKVFTGLCALYHKLDESGDGSLNKVELDKSLIDFHIEVLQEHFDDLWEFLDTDSSGFMEYDVFMRAFLGEMSESRKTLVRKAFRKIDSNKMGEVTFADIKKFYNAHKHPRVRSRECTEAEIVDNFLYHFSHTAVKSVISFHEFEVYYEGLSVCVDKDDDFNRILQNAWSI